MLTTLQNVANNGNPNVTLELRADNETFIDQYKTFEDNPTLEVWYNYPPIEPYNLAVSGAVQCTNTTYTSDSTPTLSGYSDDGNPTPLSLTSTVSLETGGGTAVTINNPHDTEPSGNKQSIGTQALGNGAYKFNMFVTNNVTGDGGHAQDLSSPTTPWFPFTVLATPSTKSAWLQSYDYPPNQWGQPQGAPGTFTLGTNGASNIVGFAYSFDTAANVTVPTTTDCNYLNNGGLGTSLDASGNPKWSGELALTSATQAQIRVPAASRRGSTPCTSRCSTAPTTPRSRRPIRSTSRRIMSPSPSR